jgi:hypothetical protein
MPDETILPSTHSEYDAVVKTPAGVDELFHTLVTLHPSIEVGSFGGDKFTTIAPMAIQHDMPRLVSNPAIAP